MKTHLTVAVLFLVSTLFLTCKKSSKNDIVDLTGTIWTHEKTGTSMNYDSWKMVFTFITSSVWRYNEYTTTNGLETEGYTRNGTYTFNSPNINFILEDNDNFSGIIDGNIMTVIIEGDSYELHKQ